jgi:hypothetical protein
MSDQETEEELVPEATVKKYLTVRSEGTREVNRLLDYYNLDMNNDLSCLSWFNKEADHETQV